jgi:UDP-2-acetamido-2,6-beta-L-arabino-hexul-4-ose reductase
MVVGNGMLAKAFEKYVHSENITIFASGVSNSNETDDTVFLREENLLKEHIRSKNQLIYFSSCDALYASKINKKYYYHKLRMEELIKTETESFNVFRIPQIIGSTRNKMSLISFFINKIRNHESFEIWGNAKKNLIHVNDVVKIVSYIIDNGLALNSIQNIGNSNYYSLQELIESLENILNLKGDYRILDKGFIPDYDLSFSNDIAKKVNLDFHRHYLSDSLKEIIYI